MELPESINLGLFEYVNIWPIYYNFLFTDLPHPFKLYYGNPAALNQMFGKGYLGVSSISSIHYPILMQDPVLKKIVKIVPNMALASRGKAHSVLFLSKIPLEKISGQQFLATSVSATSTVLLQIIFRVLGIPAELVATTHPEAELELHGIGALLIGDSALIARERFKDLYCYDLGEMWWKITKKPFVWALWGLGIVEKVSAICRLLFQSREAGLANLSLMAEKASQKLGIGKEFMEEYYKSFDYYLSEENLEGLLLFYKMASDLEISPPCKSIKFSRLSKELILPS